MLGDSNISIEEKLRTIKNGKLTLVDLSIRKALEKLYESPFSLCKDKSDVDRAACLYLYLYALESWCGDGDNGIGEKDFLRIMGLVQEINTQFCDPRSGINTGGPYVPPAIRQSFDIRFGTTTLSTVFTDPSETDYINSVIDALAVNTYTTKPIYNGDVCAAGPFNNLTNKVLFVLVPQEQEIFTKWSILGDNIQKDLPIDSNFLPINSVIFRTAIGSNTAYIIRFQTALAAPLILS